ncbi:MAG: right-handed parallel beta-helix repeat-containing protein [Eubacteriales bacterium]
MKRRFIAAMLIMLLTLSGCVADGEQTDITGKDDNMGGMDMTFSLGEHDLILSPEGDDNWSGRLTEPSKDKSDGPLATVAEAQKRLKALKGKLGDDESVTVWLRGGRYSLTKKLSFGAADLSGVVYRAYPGEKPVLDATSPVSDFTETVFNGKDAWSTPMPEVKRFDNSTGPLYPHQAFGEDGERLQRPRWPENGFLYAAGVPGVEKPFEAVWNEGVGAMTYSEGDLPVFSQPEQVDIRVFHYWKDERMDIKSVDQSKNEIYFTSTTSMAMKQESRSDIGARYFAENVARGPFGTPGQFYVDRDTGVLYYVPLPGQKLGDTVLYVSCLSELMSIEHVRARGEVSLSYVGLTFSGADWRDGEGSHAQAASDVSPAIKLFGAKDVSFTGCTFEHMGGTALSIGEGSSGVSIVDCDFLDIGANGINISGYNTDPPDPLSSLHDVTVKGCIIRGFGRVYAHGVGILLQYAYDCTLSENEISDGYYTGISVGWVWGYSYNITKNIKIERNHIFNIGQGLLSDMGGIYTLGIQPGTVIRNNLIHDIEMNSYGGWAIYPDEGSSQLLIENNVCYNVSAQPFHQHYGRENIVRNNIFAFGEGGQFLITRKEEHTSVIMEHNILVSDSSSIYAIGQGGPRFTDDSNLIWDYSGEVFSGPMNYDAASRVYSPPTSPLGFGRMKNLGWYKGAVSADPLFKDPFNGDFTLQPDSPAYALGFKDIDLSEVGPARLRG